MAEPLWSPAQIWLKAVLVHVVHFNSALCNTQSRHITACSTPRQLWLTMLCQWLVLYNTVCHSVESLAWNHTRSDNIADINTVTNNTQSRLTHRDFWIRLSEHSRRSLRLRTQRLAPNTGSPSYFTTRRSGPHWSSQEYSWSFYPPTERRKLWTREKAFPVASHQSTSVWNMVNPWSHLYLDMTVSMLRISAGNSILY